MKILSNKEYQELIELKDIIINQRDLDLRIRALESFLIREGYDIPKYEKHYGGLYKYETYNSTFLDLDYTYKVKANNSENERKDIYIKMLENILKGNVEEEDNYND
jgi:hypothetical protein